MGRQVPPSTGRVCGLQRVARLRGVPRATIYRHRRSPGAGERKRSGPGAAVPDDDLVAAIRQLLTGSPFHGAGHREPWARPRFAGPRTGRRRALRLMRAHGLPAPRRAGRPRGPKAHDGTTTTGQVDLMRGSDLTPVMTGEGQAAVSVAVDHGSAEGVGLHASRRADRFAALEPVGQAVRERFGASAKDVAAGLRLRHDHGSRCVSHHSQAEIRSLSIESSPAFVREPEGPVSPAGITPWDRAEPDGCAERFIRALKGNLPWARPSATIEELRLARVAFRRTCNQTRIIERHGCKTPAQVRAEQLGQLPLAA